MASEKVVHKDTDGNILLRDKHQLIVVFLVLKGQTILPDTVENVSNQITKAHTLIKREQSKLREEINVKQMMTTAVYTGGNRSQLFALKQDITVLISKCQYAYVSFSTV